MKDKNMKSEELFELLGKYISKECSGEEEKEVTRWLNSDPSNSRILQELKETCVITQNIQIDFQPDKETAWKKINAEIALLEKLPIEKRKTSQTKNNKLSLYPQQAPFTSGESRKAIWPMIWKIAAVFIIGFSIFEVYNEILKVKDIDRIIVAQFIDTVKVINLPDGSKVWLNDGASLQYPENFSGNIREVALNGEAFFEVSRDESKPFIIKGYGTEVKVLGTSFLYRSIPSEESDFIIVKTGRVSFTEKGNSKNSVILEPGFKAGFDYNNKSINKTENDNKNYLSWQTRRLIFENERFDKVISDLSKYYKRKFVIEDPKLIDTRLTVTFDNQPISEAVKILELALDKQFIDSARVMIIR
jgi:transmembrane sensor